MSRASLCAFVLIVLSGSGVRVSAQTRTASQPVTPISVAGIKALLHERHGKVLFLNVWATWCAPCAEEFPDIVKIHQTYSGDSVEVCAISIDYPDEIESKILPFITSHKIPFRVYVSNIKKDEDLMNALQPSWNGAVPATFIFDRNGKLCSFMTGQREYQTFEAALDSVLRSRR